MTDETLGFHGAAVKALGGGKVAGLLVRYGSPADTDAEGEYFTPQTDYGLDTATKARVLYQHGMSRLYGKQRLGTVELTQTPEGIHAEGLLLVDTVPAAKAIYARVEAGELGWSSGSSAHLRERRAVKGAREIVSWPILEASLTPTPAETRNRAYAIKSLIEDATGGEVPSLSLFDRSEALVSEAEEVVALYEAAVKARQSVGRRPLSDAKRTALESVGKAVKALLDATRPRPDPATVRKLRAALLADEIEAITP